LPIRIEFVARTGSTNMDLLGRIARGERVAEGYWLVADRQTEGRGRQGRSWHDAPGNFMGSTVVNLLPGDPLPASLSFVAAMAAYEVVVNHLAAPQTLVIKWPNDLMLAGAKLSGILLERVGDAAVIGIGVNLAAAPSLPDRAARHLGESGPAPDRDAFARDLAASFDREIDRWRQFGLDPLFARLLAASYPLGSVLTVHGADGNRLTGEFCGLEPDGALRLRLADGAVHAVHAGDITEEGP
jgi:BirA family transcriptional regulator, biotin operon repressor / biotin---[acetyl-CoA-carboxylase] ligase